MNVEADIERKGAELVEARAVEAAEAERLSIAKRGYLAAMKSAFVAYCKEAHANKGVPVEEFPKLRLPRPSKDVMEDSEVKRLWLAYRRDADVLRNELASGVPRKAARAGGTQPQRQEQGQRRAVEQVRTERNRGKGR